MNTNNSVKTFTLEVGKKYPRPFTPNSVSSELFVENNLIEIASDNISDEKLQAYQYGEIHLAIDSDSITPLIELAFCNKKGNVQFTACFKFDIRKLPHQRLVLPTLEDGNGLDINLNIIDSSTGILVVGRGFSFPPTPSRFLAQMAMNQLSHQ